MSDLDASLSIEDIVQRCVYSPTQGSGRDAISILYIELFSL